MNKLQTHTLVNIMKLVIKLPCTKAKGGMCTLFYISFLLYFKILAVYIKTMTAVVKYFRLNKENC